MRLSEGQVRQRVQLSTAMRVLIVDVPSRRRRLFRALATGLDSMVLVKILECPGLCPGTFVTMERAALEQMELVDAARHMDALTGEGRR